MTDTATDYSRAACVGTPQEWFFPNHGGPNIYTRAVDICNTCPIRRQCHNEHTNERFGVWGGTTPEQRGYTRHGSRINLPTAA